MFRCDRCKKPFDGIGLPGASGYMAWLPLSHSFSTAVKIIITDFQESRDGQRDADPQLCKQCVADILILFIEKVMRVKPALVYTGRDQEKEEA